MTFRPLTDPKKIQECFEAFRGRFARRGAVVPGVRPYGYSVPEVRWHVDLGIWSALGEDWRSGAKGDWFALFGIGKPTPNRPADIILEVNVYKREPTRQIDGRYFTDDFGTLYVGRTSTANRGRGTTVPIVSAAPQWTPDLVTIDWARKKDDTEQVILVGAVKEDNFAERLAAFVKTVHSIKTGVGPNNLSVPARTATTGAPKGPTYSPEFDGETVFDQAAKKVIIKHDHARIIAALKAELERLGNTVVANDGARDLFIPARGSEAKVLFEAKKSNDTQDTYTAIGQLMFHGARQQVDPVRVLVSAAGAKSESLEILKKLGIKVVTFAVDEIGSCSFEGLDQVLPSKGVGP